MGREGGDGTVDTGHGVVVKHHEAADIEQLVEVIGFDEGRVEGVPTVDERKVEAVAAFEEERESAVVRELDDFELVAVTGAARIVDADVLPLSRLMRVDGDVATLLPHAIEDGDGAGAVGEADFDGGADVALATHAGEELDLPRVDTGAELPCFAGAGVDDAGFEDLLEDIVHDRDTALDLIFGVHQPWSSTGHHDVTVRGWVAGL